MRQLAVFLVIFLAIPSVLADHGVTIKEIELSSCYVLPEFDPESEVFYHYHPSLVTAKSEYGFKIKKNILILAIKNGGIIYEKETIKEIIDFEIFEGDAVPYGGNVKKAKHIALQELLESYDRWITPRKKFVCSR